MPIRRHCGRWWLAGIFVLAASLLAAPALAQGPVRVEATLIKASDSDGPKDNRVSRYEPNLRRMFRFKSYQYAGGGSTSAAVPATAQIGLGQGHSLQIKLAPAAGNKIEAGINWRGPSGTMLNTTAVMSRGSPLILGSGTMIIAITVR